MGIFSFLQRKVSATARNIGFSQLGQPKYTPDRYDKLSEEGYKKNVIVYSCITLIARNAAKVPIDVYKDGTELDYRATDPVSKLLRRPNPRQSWASFCENALSYYLMHGNQYTEGVGSQATSAQGQAIPEELWTHRPDRMRVVVGALGPQGYVYTVNGQENKWKADPVTGTSEIMHMRMFNPLDDWYGMSPLTVARTCISQFNSTQDWNVSLVQSGGNPPGAFTYAPEGGGVLSPDIRKELEKSIEEKRGNRGKRDMILDGGLSWQATGLSPADMEYVQAKDTSARDICRAFNVSPLLLNIPGDNTYSNYKEARQAFYEDVILPLLRSFLDELLHWWGSGVEDQYELKIDEDELPALAPKREAKWKAVETANWLTIDEKREATGYEPTESEEGQQVLIPAGLIPLSAMSDEPPTAETGSPAAPQSPTEESTEDQEDEA